MLPDIISSATPASVILVIRGE
ncbi:hypothetical protein ID866_9084 [Astraeus odoratus]|nr:hypothetical protein ID866_9084 [Astraeus odoratus]